MRRDALKTHIERKHKDYQLQSKGKQKQFAEGREYQFLQDNEQRRESIDNHDRVSEDSPHSEKIKRGNMLSDQRKQHRINLQDSPKASMNSSKAKRRIDKQIEKGSHLLNRSRSHSSSNQQEKMDEESSNLKRQKLDSFNHNGFSQASNVVETQAMSIAKMYKSLMSVTKLAMEKINDQDQLVNLQKLALESFNNSVLQVKSLNQRQVLSFQQTSQSFEIGQYPVKEDSPNRLLEESLRKDSDQNLSLKGTQSLVQQAGAQQSDAILVDNIQNQLIQASTQQKEMIQSSQDNHQVLASETLVNTLQIGVQHNEKDQINDDEKVMNENKDMIVSPLDQPISQSSVQKLQDQAISSENQDLVLLSQKQESLLENDKKNSSCADSNQKIIEEKANEPEFLSNQVELVQEQTEKERSASNPKTERITRSKQRGQQQELNKSQKGPLGQRLEQSVQQLNQNEEEKEVILINSQGSVIELKKRAQQTKEGLTEQAFPRGVQNQEEILKNESLVRLAECKLKQYISYQQQRSNYTKKELQKEDKTAKIYSLEDLFNCCKAYRDTPKRLSKELEKIVLNCGYSKLVYLTEGGQSVILKAFDMEYKTEVLLKVPKKQMNDFGMLNEFYRLRGISHKGNSFVQLVALLTGPMGKNDDSFGPGPYILVLEYLNGYETLHEYMLKIEKEVQSQLQSSSEKDKKDIGRIGDAQLLYQDEDTFFQRLILLKNIADAIDSLHSIGYSHNDISLGNIMINLKTLDVKLIDFGISSYLGEFFNPLGTSCFMDEETKLKLQKRENITVTKRKDLYPFSIISIVLMQSYPPFAFDIDMKYKEKEEFVRSSQEEQLRFKDHILKLMTAIEGEKEFKQLRNVLKKKIDQLKEEKDERDQYKKSSQKKKNQQQQDKGGQRQIKIDTLMKKKI